MKTNQLELSALHTALGEKLSLSAEWDQLRNVPADFRAFGRWLREHVPAGWAAIHSDLPLEKQRWLTPFLKEYLGE